MNASIRALTILVGFPFAAASCHQEKIICTTGHGDYAVRYQLVEGTGACAELTAGVVGVESYLRGDNGPDKHPLLSRSSVALRAEELGTLVSDYGVEVAPKALAALAPFTQDNPGPDGFCPVGPMMPVTLTLPAVDAMPDGMGGTTKALPAVSVTYAWSNVRLYVTPSSPGTQFSADLKYTLDGCTATYKVSGLYPVVSCEVTMTVTGPDGKSSEKGTGVGDETLCSPCPNPAAGRAAGSGIGPEVEIECDGDSFFCLPKTATPSLRATPLQCKETPGPADGGAPATDSATTAPDAAPDLSSKAND